MILAVAGGKGGVGTTTVAYNLAAALDRAGTRPVLVDGDLGLADLPPARGPDLHDVLAGRAAPLEAVAEDGPVPLLPCGRSLHGLRAADPTAMGPTLRAVEDEYGTVVVDCPPGMGGDVGAILCAADGTVAVLTPSEPALADAVRLRGLAATLDAGLVAAALNRVDDVGDPAAERAERALGAPVVTVPTDERLERAMRSGVPVGADAAGPFAALAERVQSASST